MSEPVSCSSQITNFGLITGEALVSGLNTVPAIRKIFGQEISCFIHKFYGYSQSLLIQTSIAEVVPLSGLISRVKE